LLRDSLGRVRLNKRAFEWRTRLFNGTFTEVYLAFLLLLSLSGSPTILTPKPPIRRSALSKTLLGKD